MIFYLVRHGQTNWNIEKRMQGHADVPMNEVGIKQMNDLADKIIEANITFDRIISSPLVRAKLSAEIIAKKINYKKDIIFDEFFIERDCGKLEGVIWTPDINLDDPRIVESIDELCIRAKQAIDRYSFSKDEKVMIVAHGAILTALRTVLSDYKIDYFDRTIPIIQGNILCCVKEENKESIFYNLF